METQDGIKVDFTPPQKPNQEKVEAIAENFKNEILKANSFEEVVKIASNYYAFDLETSAQLIPWFETVSENINQEFESKGLTVTKSTGPEGAFYCAVDKGGKIASSPFVAWSNIQEFKNLVSNMVDPVYIMYFLNAFDRGFNKNYFVKLFVKADVCFADLNLDSCNGSNREICFE